MDLDEEEAIVLRAAAADRDFWRLVQRYADDGARKRAIFDARVRATAALRGEPASPAPIWAPFRVAVDTELERQRPAIAAQLAMQRQAKRTGLGCGLVQLERSRRVAARSRLCAIVRSVPLALHELADVMGVEPRTVSNHLAGRPIAQSRAAWYHRVESIDVRDGRVTITLRYLPTRKRWGWRRPRGQRRIAYSDGPK